MDDYIQYDSYNDGDLTDNFLSPEAERSNLGE
jgi:hypothetical protein